MIDDPEGLRFAAALHHRPVETPRGAPLSPSIVPASVYHQPGDPSGDYQYGRWSNPTWTALEAALGVIEDAEVVVFPSGMAATASVLYSQLRPGDRVLLPSDGYYATRAFTETYLGRFGVRIETCATADMAGVDLAGLRLVWIETPSNPGLEVCDIAEVAARARAAGCLVVVDNTTMTPLGQQPLDLGADIVVVSATKAINGHSDTLMGYVAARDPTLAAASRDWRKFAGAIPGPFEAWMVHRGLETLDVRFERMCATAGVMAQRLAANPKVLAVRYPGLPGDRSHAIARARMRRFGSMIGLTLGSKEAAERFIEAAAFVRATTSFGGVHTSAERRARWGDQVPAGFIRLSIGCEPADVLWQDMEDALRAC